LVRAKNSYQKTSTHIIQNVNIFWYLLKSQERQSCKIEFIIQIAFSLPRIICLCQLFTTIPAALYQPRRHVEHVAIRQTLARRLQYTAIPAVLATEVSDYEAANSGAGPQLRVDVEEGLVALHGKLDERDQELVVDCEELDIRLFEQGGRELVEAVEQQVACLVDRADDLGGAGGCVGKVVELGEQVLDDESGGQVDVFGLWRLGGLEGAADVDDELEVVAE